MERAEDIERSLLKEGRSFSKESEARIDSPLPAGAIADFLGHYKPDKTRQEAEAYLEEICLKQAGRHFLLPAKGKASSDLCNRGQGLKWD